MPALDRLKSLWRSRTRLQLLELDRELRMTRLKESAGIKQNAESFFALVLYVIRNGLHNSFHFLPCESRFRVLRYLGGSDRV